MDAVSELERAVARASIISECHRLGFQGPTLVQFQGSLVRAGDPKHARWRLAWYQAQQLPRLDGNALARVLGYREDIIDV